MKLGRFRRTNIGLATAFYALAILVIPHMWNWFEPTDDLLRNTCLRLNSSASNGNQLLLIYADPESLQAASPPLLSLIQQINKHAPKKIAVETTGSINNFDALNHLPNSARLTAGFKHDDLVAHLGKVRKAKFTAGFTDLHHSDQSVYRNGVTTVVNNKLRLRSFEYEVAKSSSPLSDNLPNSFYGIRFSGGANSIANIRASDLLNGNMLRELIRDKIVLIGPDYPREFHLLTPAIGDARMSRLELRGNMVASLTRENYVATLPATPALLLLALISIASVQITRQTLRRWLPLPLLASVILPVILFAACFSLNSIWLPGTAMILASLLPVVMVILRRFSKLEEYVQFWKVRSTTAEHHLQSRFDEDVWQAIGDSAYQMFQPTRMVMMELAEGATHLKRVRSIGCDYSQIHEKRLDYHRPPYWAAIEQKHPQRSDKRQFFSAKPGVREVEYMLPLVRGVKVYGMIAIAMDRKTLETWTDFDSFLTRFCSEISNLVNSNRGSEKLQTSMAKLKVRLRKFPEERAFGDIQSISETQDDLAERIRIAFDNCESALATFDIYGRVVRRNSNLNSLLQETELSISRTNFVDVIVALGGLSVPAAQQIFREAVLSNKSDRHLITNPANGNSAMMYIKPMQLSEDDARTSIESRGVLLEIVDGQAFEDVQQWNNQLWSSMLPKALQKASQLQEKNLLLNDEQTKEQTLLELFGSVGETVTEIVSVLETCKQLSQNQITESPENFFLLDAIAVWKLAKSEFEDTLQQRSISVIDEFCLQGQLATVANPILLGRVFTTIVKFLLENAFDESEITIETLPRGDKVEFRFTNQGGGTPVDTLRKSLDQDANKTLRQPKNKFTNLDTAHIDQLQQIDTWICQWNGDLSVENLPHCITVSLTLATRMKGSTEAAATKLSPPLTQQ